MINFFKKDYQIIDKNPYNHKPLGYKGLLLKNIWKKEYNDLIEKNNIKAMFLNCSFGWVGNDYSFINEIPPVLLELNIIDDYIKKFDGINYQTQITKLNLDAILKSKINFLKLSNLEDLYLHAEELIDESLYGCISLKKLYINEFKLGDNHNLQNLINLKQLTIGNSNITSLEFLEDLTELQTLELYNCKKIESFKPIKHLKYLKRLDISGYRDIGDLSFLKNLSNLEILMIDAGEVDSISFLNDLQNIKALSIYGNKSYIKDKDLQPIKKLCDLSMLDIPNKKDYKYKVDNYWNWDDFGKVRKDWIELKGK